MAFHIAGRGLNREMGCRERHETEERSILEPDCMILQAPDRVVGDRCGGVVIRIGRDRFQFDIIFRMEPGSEIPVVIIQSIGALKSTGQRLSIHVPFPGMVGAVAQVLEVFGQEFGPGGAFSVGTARNTGDGIPSHLLRIEPAEGCSAGGPTASRIVKLGVAKSARSESVEVRCRYLAPVAPEIGEPQVIRQNQDYIGASVRGTGYRGQKRACP